MSSLEDRARIARTVLMRAGGVAPLRAFVAEGLTGVQVAHLMRLGIITRARVGWYADPAVPEVALRAIRVGGVLGCTSAAATWGIVVPEDAGRHVEVSVTAGSSRLRFADDATRLAAAGRDRASRWHWERRIGPAEAWRVGPKDAILQMAACVTPRWLVAAIDSARCEAQRPAVLTDAEVAEVREALPERLRWTVDRSDPRSATSGETFVRLECEDRRITFVPQHPWTTAYRPDGTVAGWLPIEVDGMESHSGRRAVERDREKDGTIAQFGMHPLRFTQAAAVRETGWVGDVIERVWRRGRPPGLRLPPAA